MSQDVPPGELEAVEIRAMAVDDLPSVNRIYNHYVERSHCTFDLDPISPDRRRQWFDQFEGTGRHRALVLLEGHSLVGWASSQRLRPKPAYAPSVETTVYLEPDLVGRGLGTRLYRRLLELLEQEDVHRAYAAIPLPNPASIRLHEKLGFRHVGTFSEAGRKFGRYWDLVWLERRFGERLSGGR